MLQRPSRFTRRHAMTATTLAALLAGTPALARHDGDDARTATPIKHVVVIFQENVSFDHYFATYPNAANAPGERPFEARPDTPSVNGLRAALLHANPNAGPPFRLGPAQAVTCDQDHNYTAEQAAFDFGLMDKFVEFAGNGGNGLRRQAGHGLLRRQHRHRALELRAALRHERQLVRHHLRPVDAGRAQPRLRPDRRRDADRRRQPRRRRQRHRRSRSGLRRLLEPEGHAHRHERAERRRSARRARRHLGLVRGRLPSDVVDQRRARAVRRDPRRPRRPPCPTTSRTTSRSSTTPRRRTRTTCRRPRRR